MPILATIIAFAFRKLINVPFLYYRPRSVFRNICYWRGANLLVSFSVPQLSAYCGIPDQ